MNIIDINSGGEGLAAVLSNFARYKFIFDGITCASMEGFLQSLKFSDPEIQKEVCLLSGIKAKERGKEKDNEWKISGILWWKGKAYNRFGNPYRKLITRAFEVRGKNENFRRVLIATGSDKLIHSVGKSDMGETILTEQEFCGILTRQRKKFISELNNS